MTKIPELLLAVLAFFHVGMMVAAECNPQIITKDVVIIGAGIAGLNAGKTLLEDEDPLDFVILEAQDNRVGGRIRSNSEWFRGYTVEEGANWFSDNTRNPTLALARDYGVEIFNQDFESYNIYGYDENGADVLDGHFSSVKINQAYNCLQKEAGKLYKEKGNFLYDPLEDGIQAVQRERCGWTEESSLDYYYDWITHGYEFAEKDSSMFSYPNRIYFYAKFFLIMDQNGGFEKFPISFAQEFLGCSGNGCEHSSYFMFNQRVQKISYNLGGDYPVLVETNLEGECPSHRFVAKRVISTLPVGVMNSNTVKFDPPLPYPSPFKMADYVKVFYQFSEKFWEDNEFIVSVPNDYNEILATQGRCIHWQNMDYSNGRNTGPKQSSPNIAPGSKILFCTLLTEAFQQLLEESGGDKLTDEQLKGTMLEPLTKVYGDEIVDLVVDVKYPMLYKDPNFYGSYENWQVGFDLVNYYQYFGGILSGSDPLVAPCEHNGCPAGDWTLLISGSASCRANFGFVRGAFDGGARSANFVRADIGCGGSGCVDVDTTSACDDMFVNNGQN